ncbi:MAG: HAD family hydrolase [Eubacterium sp.]|nr:HAD family hydrolase [Eubacterium sp.]
MSKYDTVLFDFDGTIVDSTPAVLGAWKHTYDMLKPGQYNESACLSTFGEQLDVSLHRYFPETPVDEAVAIYRDWQISRLPELVKAFPGVFEALGRIHGSGFRLGLVTSRHRETADVLFDLFNVRDYFDAVVVCEDTERHKPDPEPIDKALRILGSEAEKSLYVGDAVFDLLTAHNAGVDYALVMWTKTYDVERDEAGTPVRAVTGVTDDQPEYFIESPDEIIDVL